MNRNERIYEKILKKSVDEKNIFSKAKYDEHLQERMAKDNEFAVYYHLNYNAYDKAERKAITERIKENNAKVMKKIDQIDGSKVVGGVFGMALAGALVGVTLVIAGICTPGPMGSGISTAGAGILSAATLEGVGCMAVVKSYDYKKYKNDLLLEKLNEGSKEYDSDSSDAEIIEEPSEIEQ